MVSLKFEFEFTLFRNSRLSTLKQLFFKRMQRVSLNEDVSPSKVDPSRSLEHPNTKPSVVNSEIDSTNPTNAGLVTTESGFFKKE